MARSSKQTGTDKTATPTAAGRQPEAMSKSMHDGIAVWCDCCSCEMEPYWAEVAREMEVQSGDNED